MKKTTAESDVPHAFAYYTDMLCYKCINPKKKTSPVFYRSEYIYYIFLRVAFPSLQHLWYGSISFRLNLYTWTGDTNIFSFSSIQGRIVFCLPGVPYMSKHQPNY